MARIGTNTGWVLALSFALAYFVGCDSGPTTQTIHLQGKVTIGGRAIPENATARINFRPVDIGQAPGTSAEIKNGAYDAPDAPKGKLMVSFDITQPTGKIVSFDGVARPEPEMKDLVPAAKASGVEITQEADKSDLNFDL